MKKFIIVLFLLSYYILCSAQKVGICRPQYKSTFDTLLQCPVQVEWLLTGSDIVKGEKRCQTKFQKDRGIEGVKATHEDYSLTGYDRGHMCPAADRSSSPGNMKETYYISNCAPQLPSLNRGEWLQTERYCRAQALVYDSIEVLVLPIFLSRDTTFIGANHIAVPHAYLKVAWLHTTEEVIGIWFFWNH